MAKTKREPLLAPDGSGLAETFHSGLLFGPNGCGKTTLAEQIARYYYRGTKVRGKVWAIDPNGAWEETEGVKSLWPAEGGDGIDAMLIDSERWGPGLMIFDDADAYIRHSTEIQTNYMTRNRHYRKDMLIVARRPQGIPKDAIVSARFVVLFAGSLMEKWAKAYFASIYPEEIIDAVPTTNHHYLLIMRDGGKLSYERRKTSPRKIRTKSDKTGYSGSPH